MNLTIVTSCAGYGQYLAAWAASIVRQTLRPEAVVIFTHGSDKDFASGNAAAIVLTSAGLPNVQHEHAAEIMDFGVARNRAVSLARTEWVMHLDADDTLLPHALADFAALAPEADVISAGYVLTGAVPFGVSTRDRLYKDGDGERHLDAQALCSGVSPFRRSFWERSPYRTDMLGAWDTALWIGFARLGARFRATKRAVFQYHQHPDSIFSQRRTILGWRRVRTTAQLKALRRQYHGVAILVPRDLKPAPDRERVWTSVKAHYAAHHPDWELIEGKCPTPYWVKGAAIATALGKTSAETVIIADADCLVDPDALREAVRCVEDRASWAMPHRMVYRATASWTASYCGQGPRAVAVPDALARPAYEGAPGGGIFVMRRVWYESIGGIPYAFRGWGSEDRALACLADTLLGPCSRGSAPLVHLYHEPQASTPAQSASNLQLLRILGAAALRGKDALVSVAYTMPNPSAPGGAAPAQWKRYAGTARPVVTPAEVMMPMPAVIRRRVP